MGVRIPTQTLREITDTTKERNIYVHPNPLARHIFWQRLERLFQQIKTHLNADSKVIDLGGGSGVFIKALGNFFRKIEIIDLDTADAGRIVQHLGLKNVTIHTQDIRGFSSDRPYDAIIAADVLEHFSDLDIPLQFILKNLKKDGHLFLSLPTENWIYELGRKIVRKQKPADHYHSAAQVISFLEKNGFTRVQTSWVPAFGLSIPLFFIGTLRLTEKTEA
jgi:predicted TPR repeat methyltransferase